MTAILETRKEVRRVEDEVAVIVLDPQTFDDLEDAMNRTFDREGADKRRLTAIVLCCSTGDTPRIRVERRD